MRPRGIDDMLLMRDRGDDLADFCDRKRPAPPHQVGKGGLEIAVDIVAVLADNRARKAAVELVIVMADDGREEIPLVRRSANDLAQLSVAAGT